MSKGWECTFDRKKFVQNRHCAADTIILNDAGHILLAQRALDDPIEAGKWCLPGGHIDKEDTASDAAIREALEETGYEITDVKFLFFTDSLDRRNNVLQNIAFIFSAKVGRKIQEPDDEIAQIKWFDPANLPDIEETAFDHLELITRGLKI